MSRKVMGIDMSEISKEVSYIKGLAEGLKLSDKSDEGKLIAKLIDVLSDAADEIEALWARNDELEARIEELDSEIYAAEMDIDNLYDDFEDILSEDDYDEEYDDFEDFDEDEDDSDILDMYDDEDDLFEIMCPECGEDVVVDFDMLDEENNIVCPNCHQEIELEFDMEDGED